jgi:hypothetical protein
VHLLDLEDLAPLGVAFADAFFDAYLLLDDSAETFSVLIGLLDEAIKDGEDVRPLNRSRWRVVRTPVGSCRRPMRLYFRIEEGTVRFAYVEHYDENQP